MMDLRKLCTIKTPEGPFPPQASEIIPRLYISDLYTAQDRPTLRRLGITHVVSVMRGSIELPEDLQLGTLQIPVEDRPFEELVEHLAGATGFIHHALASSPRTKILVHCGMGVSRSSSVVCAYMMAEYGLSVEDAMEHVRARRRVATPNFGFVTQLREYEAQIGRSR